MNSTQRKYAVKKLEDIANKCVSEFKKENTPKRPNRATNAELGKLIVSEGLTSVVMHPAPKHSYSNELCSLFCLESELETLTYYIKANALFNSNLSELKEKTEAALESAVDEIMLGNDALKAIANFKKLVGEL